MDAATLLKNQGWNGPGHSLDKRGLGLKKPLLVAHKGNVLGVGKKVNDFADQWWMRAFDKGLKDLGTKDASTTTLAQIRTGSVKRSGLYGFFVSGGRLEGTIGEESGSSTPSVQTEASVATQPDGTQPVEESTDAESDSSADTESDSDADSGDMGVKKKSQVQGVKLGPAKERARAMKEARKIATEKRREERAPKMEAKKLRRAQRKGFSNLEEVREHRKEKKAEKRKLKAEKAARAKGGPPKAPVLVLGAPITDNPEQLTVPKASTNGDAVPQDYISLDNAPAESNGEFGAMNADRMAMINGPGSGKKAKRDKKAQQPQVIKTVLGVPQPNAKRIQMLEVKPTGEQMIVERRYKQEKYERERLMRQKKREEKEKLEELMKSTAQLQMDGRVGKKRKAEEEPEKAEVTGSKKRKSDVDMEPEQNGDVEKKPKKKSKKDKKSKSDKQGDAVGSEAPKTADAIAKNDADNDEGVALPMVIDEQPELISKPKPGDEEKDPQTGEFKKISKMKLKKYEAKAAAKGLSVEEYLEKKEFRKAKKGGKEEAEV